MTVLNLLIPIIAATIGLAGAVTAALIVRNGRKLDQIHILVNSRLTEALSTIANQDATIVALRFALGELEGFGDAAAAVEEPR